MSNALATTRFVAYRPILQFLGRTYHLETPEGSPLLVVKMALFRLREKIVGADQAGAARLHIQARQIFDFGATYDVTDPTTGERLGAWRRQGLKSMLRDTWVLLDTNDREIGKLEEENMLLALIRRFLTNLIPQTFAFTREGASSGEIRQRFHLFRLTYDVGLQGVDPRLAQAIAVLLLAIEGRQG